MAKGELGKGACSIYSGCSCSRRVYMSVLFIVVKVRVNTRSSLYSNTGCLDQFEGVPTFKCQHYGGNRENMGKEELMSYKFIFSVSLVKLRPNSGF